MAQNLAAAVFEAHGMDFCCHGKQTPAAACAAHHVSVGKNIALVGLLLFFSVVHLFIFYLGLLCWRGKCNIKIRNGILSYYAGVFGIGRRISCAVADIQEMSIESGKRKDKWRTVAGYDLKLQLRNAKIKKIPLGEDFPTVELIEKYVGLYIPAASGRSS